VRDVLDIGTKTREEVSEWLSGVSQTDMIASVQMWLDQLRKLRVDGGGGRLEEEIEKVDVDEERVRFAALEILAAFMQKLSKAAQIGRLADDARPYAWRIERDVMPVSWDLEEGLGLERVHMNAPLHNIAQDFWNADGVGVGGNGGQTYPLLFKIFQSVSKVFNVLIHIL
jgi:hypothetical protein